MRYIDPITKKYYDLFTKGKKADKLKEVTNFYSIYRYIMDVLVPITNEHGGIITANITKAIVDKNGNGYALLNVLCNVDGYNAPVDSITDLAWIENFEMHTWFPYPQIAYHTANSTVKILDIEGMDNKDTNNKAMKFIRQTSLNSILHNHISKCIFNGKYSAPDFKEALKEYILDETDLDDKEGLSYVNMIDEWDLSLKEPEEEVEEASSVLKSEMKELFVNNEVPAIEAKAVEVDLHKADAQAEAEVIEEISEVEIIDVEPAKSIVMDDDDIENLFIDAEFTEKKE